MKAAYHVEICGHGKQIICQGLALLIRYGLEQLALVRLQLLWGPFRLGLGKVWLQVNSAVGVSNSVCVWSWPDALSSLP